MMESNSSTKRNPLQNLLGGARTPNYIRDSPPFRSGGRGSKQLAAVIERSTTNADSPQTSIPEKKYAFFDGTRSPCFVRIVKENHGGGVLVQPLRANPLDTNFLIPWDGHLWMAMRSKLHHVEMRVHMQGLEVVSSSSAVVANFLAGIGNKSFRYPITSQEHSEQQLTHDVDDNWDVISLESGETLTQQTLAAQHCRQQQEHLPPSVFPSMPSSNVSFGSSHRDGQFAVPMSISFPSPTPAATSSTSSASAKEPEEIMSLVEKVIALQHCSIESTGTEHGVPTSLPPLPGASIEDQNDFVKFMSAAYSVYKDKMRSIKTSAAPHSGDIIVANTTSNTIASEEFRAVAPVPHTLTTTSAALCPDTPVASLGTELSMRDPAVVNTPIISSIHRSEMPETPQTTAQTPISAQGHTSSSDHKSSLLRRVNCETTDHDLDMVDKAAERETQTYVELNTPDEREERLHGMPATRLDSLTSPLNTPSTEDIVSEMERNSKLSFMLPALPPLPSSSVQFPLCAESPNLPVSITNQLDQADNKSSLEDDVPALVPESSSASSFSSSNKRKVSLRSSSALTKTATSIDVCHPNTTKTESIKSNNDSDSKPTRKRLRDALWPQHSSYSISAPSSSSSLASSPNDCETKTKKGTATTVSPDSITALLTHSPAAPTTSIPLSTASSINPTDTDNSKAAGHSMSRRGQSSRLKSTEFSPAVAVSLIENTDLAVVKTENPHQQTQLPTDSSSSSDTVVHFEALDISIAETSTKLPPRHPKRKQPLEGLQQPFSVVSTSLDETAQQSQPSSKRRRRDDSSLSTISDPSEMNSTTKSSSQSSDTSPTSTRRGLDNSPSPQQQQQQQQQQRRTPRQPMVSAVLKRDACLGSWPSRKQSAAAGSWAI